MPWRNLFKSKAKPPTAPAAPSAPVVGRPVGSRRGGDPNDPAVRERRRRRLEQRLQDLRYDLTLAESATRAPNRWTTRADELDDAIAQTRRDAEAVLQAPPGRVGVALPPLPVTVERVAVEDPDAPADVAFSVGDDAFRYSEELDWAERGHQLAAPQLRRMAGDVEQLLPAGIEPEQRDELREHLAHGLATLADELRDDALAGRVTPAYTLADLASPCPRCGGWRDLKGRCPACQAREWEAGRLRAEAERLTKERNDQLEEARRWAERLPVLHRQLADAEAELANFSAGADPTR
jgi:hypothetical protein